jgi:hypothetical protein
VLSSIVQKADQSPRLVVYDEIYIGRNYIRNTQLKDKGARMKEFPLYLVNNICEKYVFSYFISRLVFVIDI